MGSSMYVIYIRARVYDPATAQFITVDSIVPLTRTGVHLYQSSQ